MGIDAMPLNLSNAQLDQIANELFLFKAEKDTQLPKPVNSTEEASLAGKLDPIGADDRFKHLGIGVIDFKDLAAPRIWLHRGDDTWRIASTAKLALLLGAVQLRDDVRWIFAQKFATTPQEFDELFALPKLWARAKNKMTALLAKSHGPPRISTIFDLTAAGGPEFIGPKMSSAADTQDVIDRMMSATGLPNDEAHLQWPFTTDFDFSERLWLAGARSDNVAATSCISEIGVAYLKAVQSAYGLFNPRVGLKMLLADKYIKVDTQTPVSNRSTTIKYRRMHDVQTLRVIDGLKAGNSSEFDNHLSSQAGTAAALVAYMLAWRQENFVKSGHGATPSKVASDLIRTHLATGQAGTTRSLVVEGVASITTVTARVTKIGLLNRHDGEPGALNCEYAYVETLEPDGKTTRYGIVLTGIRKVPGGLGIVDLPKTLAAAIHLALLRPDPPPPI